MGDTPAPDIPAPSPVSRNLLAGAVVAAATIAFLLGWWLGRGTPPQPASAPPPAAARSPDPGASAPAAAAPAASSSQVDLRFDAGGLSLMPDASLRLPSIEPFHIDDLDTPPRADTGK